MDNETKILRGPPKGLIWEDCPACAYKHLTAAYVALATVRQDFSVFSQCCKWDVLMARAEILVREARDGYTGNLAVAIGCVAMAESFGYTMPTRERRPAREWRLKLMAGDLTANLGYTYRPVVEALAHIAEAVREYPDLAGIDILADPAVHITELRETVRQEIRNLEKTFELGQGSEPTGGQS